MFIAASFITTQRWKQPTCPRGEWGDAPARLHNGILARNKKAQMIYTPDNVDASQRQYAEGKKPVSEGYILWDSVDLTFSKRPNGSDGK